MGLPCPLPSNLLTPLFLPCVCSRELLVDLWLMDTGKEKCALAARDWGRTLVTPASEEEEWEAAQGVEEPSREPASPDDFLIKNDNDTCRVYSSTSPPNPADSLTDMAMSD